MTAPIASNGSRPLVEVDSLSVEFAVDAKGWGSGKSRLRAVDDVSFTISRGETVALVGESGCGKTSVGRTILRLNEPSAGTVRFDGADIFALSGAELRGLRRRAQMVFQDPYASLNPRIRVGEAIREPLRAHRIGSRKEQAERVAALLELVGLPRSSSSRYPLAFSGGQRQRICIARAIALEPEFLIADEPVSALDVSVQAQIVNLLRDLHSRLGLTMLFIAHDLALVRHLANRVVVMYLGKVVETGARDDVFGNPLHPYTQALLSAVPLPDPVAERSRNRIVLEGDPPSPITPPPGCRFHTRCPFVMDICRTESPPLLHPTRGPMRQVACHLITGSEQDAA